MKLLKQINESAMPPGHAKKMLQVVLDDLGEAGVLPKGVKATNRMAIHFDNLLDSAPSGDDMHEQEQDKLVTDLALKTYKKFNTLKEAMKLTEEQSIQKQLIHELENYVKELKSYLRGNIESTRAAGNVVDVMEAIDKTLAELKSKV